jgi:hypothetical protein
MRTTPSSTSRRIQCQHYFCRPYLLPILLLLGSNVFMIRLGTGICASPKARKVVRVLRQGLTSEKNECAAENTRRQS